MPPHPELTISHFWRRSESDLAVYCYAASGNLIFFSRVGPCVLPVNSLALIKPREQKSRKPCKWRSFQFPRLQYVKFF